MGLIVDFKDNLMTWDDIIIAMKMHPKKPPLPNELSIVSQMILNLIEDNLITMDECLSSDILVQSKYELSNIRQITQGQKQLTPSQRNELEEILLKFPKLFSGGQGKFNGEKIHLDLDPTVSGITCIRCARKTQAHLQTRTRLPCSRRCSRTRHLICMDCGNFHHTQERRTCPLGILFLQS
jgi:hypothetical protein